MGAGARLTSAGDMALSPASGLTLDLTGLNSSSASIIQSGGTLSFNSEGTLTLTISGVDQTMENDYKLITADSFGTLTASNFSFDPSGLSGDYTYALELSGNTLYLRVKALGEAPQLERRGRGYVDGSGRRSHLAGQGWDGGRL